MPILYYEFYTISAPEHDGRCTLHRSKCVMLPMREKKTISGVFYLCITGISVCVGATSIMASHRMCVLS